MEKSETDPRETRGLIGRALEGQEAMGEEFRKDRDEKMRDEHHRSRQARRTGPLSKQTIPSPRQPPAAQFCFLCSRYVLFLGCSVGLCSLLSFAIGFGVMEQRQSQTCLSPNAEGEELRGSHTGSRLLQPSVHPAVTRTKHGMTPDPGGTGSTNPLGAYAVGSRDMLRQC